jgi:hypothetical protein
MLFAPCSARKKFTAILEATITSQARKISLVGQGEWLFSRLVHRRSDLGCAPPSTKTNITAGYLLLQHHFTILFFQAAKQQRFRKGRRVARPYPSSIDRDRKFNI